MIMNLYWFQTICERVDGTVYSVPIVSVLFRDLLLSGDELTRNLQITNNNDSDVQAFLFDDYSAGSLVDCSIDSQTDIAKKVLDLLPILKGTFTGEPDSLIPSSYPSDLLMPCYKDTPYDFAESKTYLEYKPHSIWMVIPFIATYPLMNLALWKLHKHIDDSDSCASQLFFLSFIPWWALHAVFYVIYYGVIMSVLFNKQDIPSLETSWNQGSVLYLFKRLYKYIFRSTVNSSDS